MSIGQRWRDENMAKWKIGGAAVLVVLALVWALQNRAPVTTRFLFISVDMPQAALLVLTLLVGMGIGLLVAFGMRSRPSGKGTGGH